MYLGCNKTANTNGIKKQTNKQNKIMSFKLKVFIDGEESNVLRYNLNLSQSSDITGRPTQKPVLQKLLLVLESNNKIDLMQWMISPNQTKQIELHIQERQGERTRILYFSDVNLVGLETTFSATGNIPMTDNLQITAAGLNTNNSAVEYSASWRTTFPEQEAEVTTIEQERKITSYYLTNTENNKIEDYNIDDIILLNIKTENRIGDVMTINLNDKKHDFEYNGIILENDTLKNIKIENNLEQIELKVVAQTV